MELKRTSESWDGTALPDYLQGKPELVVMRYVFPVGSKLPWHHHPVINYGILQQGELTIVGLEGQRQVVRAGDAIVEMVGPIHCGMNTGDKPIVLDMFYLSSTPRSRSRWNRAVRAASLPQAPRARLRRAAGPARVGIFSFRS